MKKLNKMQINSDKLMKNEDLITLRGGYGVGITCYTQYGQCSYPGGYSCDDWYVRMICDWICPEWEHIVCAG